MTAKHIFEGLSSLKVGVGDLMILNLFMESFNTTTPLYQHLLDLMLTNPKILVAITVQILMGIGLGYYTAKVAKYILALIAIIVIGVILNVWSLGGSVEEVLKNLGAQALELKDVALRFLTLLGVLTVGPVTLGFIIGLLIAIRK